MKVVLSSIDVLDNWKTFLIHFFILPILETFVFLALHYQITASFNSRLVVASLLLASGTTAMNQMGGSFTQDIIRGIDRDLVRKSPYNLYFWGSKFVVIFLFSLTLFLTNSLLFWLAGVDSRALIMGLLVSPLVILFGLIVGLACAIFGWRLQNHYAFTNFFVSFALVFSGVVVPYWLYPPLVYPLTYILPFARIMAMLFSGAFSVHLLLQDGLIALVWFLLAVICYQYQVRRIATYTRKGML